MNHNGFWVLGLIRVPVFDGAIQSGVERGVEFVVLRCFAKVVTPGFVAESRQPDGVGFQRFGKITFSALRISWTQLFSLIGSSAMTSEPAAIKIATTAAVVGSMRSKDS